METLLTGLRAAGEPTRLRLLSLLSQCELTVTEITQILRQSQPRVSRHLKLLCEADLLDRFREGSWVFYRLAGKGPGEAIVQFLREAIPQDDPVIARDLDRLNAVREQRAEKAAAYFRQNAEEWDRIRSLYVAEEKVEAALKTLAGDGQMEAVLDLGTGTGRMLELIAGQTERAEGVDLSAEMLAFARARLDSAGYDNAHVRQGDIFDLTFEDEEFDLVIVHQVLHYLDDPAAALKEAARVLKPGGRILIADFAPHDLDYLRDEQAHRRLGFGTDEVTEWCATAGLHVAETKSLPPSGKAKLTVVIWAADKPAQEKL